MRLKLMLMLAVLALCSAGCGSFVARRIAQAPNTYPTWFAPKPRVELTLSFLTNFPAQYVDVGPPAAKLRYRVIEPADYQFKASSSNSVHRGKPVHFFKFTAKVPAPANNWTAAPRGTIVLLHGYGLAQFAMAPWAVQLAQEGWRCVLVDLRGHGRSTGRRIYFGLRETTDLSQLLDELARQGRLIEPVDVVGESYGASLALRWKETEPRVGKIVAFAPYAVLSNAVINIGRDYAGWMPGSFLRAGLNKLPAVLKTPPGELDTATVVARHPTAALLVAAGNDKIAPPSEVNRLHLLAPGGEFITVPNASHEAVTYYFDDLLQPVLAWLTAQTNPQPAASEVSRSGQAEANR